jgi:hypothetical protein
MFGSSFYHQLFISLTFFWCFQNTSNLTVEDKAEPSQENRSNEVPTQATEQKELADEGEGQEGEEETEKIEPEVETRSILTDDLKFDSTHETTQSNLSASSESNQENSTQEHTFDSNAMPEAGVGGPEILSVSSPRSYLPALECQRRSLSICKNLTLRALCAFCFPKRKFKTRPLVSILQATLLPLMQKSVQLCVKIPCC